MDTHKIIKMVAIINENKHIIIGELSEPSKFNDESRMRTQMYNDQAASSMMSHACALRCIMIKLQVQ